MIFIIQQWDTFFTLPLLLERLGVCNNHYYARSDKGVLKVKGTLRGFEGS